MGAMRTFICLKCGQRVTVDREEYEQLRANPVCASCRSTAQQPGPFDNPPEESSGISLSEGVELLERGIRGILEVSREKKKTPYLPTKVPKPQKIPTSPLVFDHQKPIDVMSRIVSAATIHKNSGAAYSWTKLGCLGDIYDNHKELLNCYSNLVGLYMHKINGEIMYIGRAIEYANGGLRKRLSDYCRPNDSARKHPSGQKIYANRYRIQTYIMVVGSDAVAAEETKELEKQFVAKYNPPWNDKLKTL